MQVGVSEPESKNMSCINSFIWKVVELECSFLERSNREETWPPVSSIDYTIHPHRYRTIRYRQLQQLFAILVSGKNGPWLRPCARRPLAPL